MPTHDHDTGVVALYLGWKVEVGGSWLLRDGKQHETQETSQKACLKIVLCVTVNQSTFHMPQSDQDNIRHIYTDSDNSTENSQYLSVH